MNTASLRVLATVALDGVCLAILVVFLLVGIERFEPFHRGFFCDDESIRYPWREDTVTATVKDYVGTLLPILIVLATEIIRKCDGEGEPLSLFGVKIPGWMVKVYKCVGIFGFGAVSSEITVGVGKITVGSLRPHFIDVCQPNVDCSDPGLNLRYIEDYICSGELSAVSDARQSFPSGHSSYAAYTMLFAILYMEQRFTWKGSFLLKYLVQFCCLNMFWFTAVSRISDNKHHPIDVMVGSLIGITVALLTWYPMKKVFKDRNQNADVATIPSLTSLHVRPHQKFQNA